EDCKKRKDAVATIEKDKNGTQDDGNNVAIDQLTLKTVYFDFDQSEITTDSQTALTDNAKWMNKNETKKVRIEGHTDSRGSTEYKLPWRQRRAQATKGYLQALGIEADRMSIVPYGEERLATEGGSETDRAKNRRAEFVP